MNNLTDIPLMFGYSDSTPIGRITITSEKIKEELEKDLTEYFDAAKKGLLHTKVRIPEWRISTEFKQTDSGIQIIGFTWLVVPTFPGEAMNEKKRMIRHGD